MEGIDTLLKQGCKAWFTICRKGLATHALTLAATQPIAGIDSNSIPAFRRVAFKRQIEKFCVNSSLAKFNYVVLVCNDYIYQVVTLLFMYTLVAQS